MGRNAPSFCKNVPFCEKELNPDFISSKVVNPAS